MRIISLIVILVSMLIGLFLAIGFTAFLVLVCITGCLFWALGGKITVTSKGHKLGYYRWMKFHKL